VAGSMPYQLEKGPYFSVTESMLSFGGDCAARLELLKLMIKGTDPNDLPSLRSTSLDKPSRPMNDAMARFDHMNEHWFGRTRAKPTDPWVPQEPFDLKNPKTTGYWRQWYGDAEQIVAQTFIRAVEVSLGIDHVMPGADLSVLAPKRCWPIEVFWRCPAPWLEGWVTWRRETGPANGNGVTGRIKQFLNGLTGSGSEGHVTVHLHTPSHKGSVLLLSPRRTGPPTKIADYHPDPVSSAAARGMWVIAHELQKQHNFYAVTKPSPPSQPGGFPLPTFGPLVESTGAVITVQPNEPDGGVLHDGRPYKP
jgi:hypothetical protein